MTLYSLFLAILLAARASEAAQNSPSPLPTVAQDSPTPLPESDAGAARDDAPTPLPDAGTTRDFYVGTDGTIATLEAGTVAGLAAKTITRGGADGPVLQLVNGQDDGMLLSDGTHFVAARVRLGETKEATLRESGGLAPGCFVRLLRYNYFDDEAGVFVVRDLSVVGAALPLVGAPTHIKTGDPLPLDIVGDVSPTEPPTAEPTSEPTPTTEPPHSTCKGAYAALETAVKEKEDILSAVKAVADQNCPFVGDRFAGVLYEAAREGKEGVVTYLLDRRADPDIIREDRTTPLYAAAERGHAGIVDSLLKAGARLAPNGTDGREAVNAVYAAVAHCRANATRLIVAAVHPMTPLLANYDTALMVAVERGF